MEDLEEGNTQLVNQRDPIKILGLSKHFGSTKAVDNLSFSIRRGEVLTLLGHNGAGKTTAIYMLTGVLNPSSGDAEVYGSSITSNLEQVQLNLGLCQQFDVLTDMLTVREHLELTCELKNTDQATLSETIKETL